MSRREKVAHYLQAIPQARMINRLTREQIADFKRAYMKYDKDRDGKITMKELGGLLKFLGKQPNDSKLRQMFEQTDLDRNGTIDFSEFLNLMSRQLKKPDGSESKEPKKDNRLTPDQIAEFKEIFHMFDKDGDGHISPIELGIVMRSVGIYRNEDQLRKMIDEVDIDGDGVVDFTEFLMLMARFSKETGSPKSILKAKAAAVNTFIDSIPKTKQTDRFTKEQIGKYKKAFMKFDRDHDGNISAKELETILNFLGSPTTGVKLLEMFEVADIDNNGTIDFSEFLNLMSQLLKKAPKTTRLTPNQVAEFREAFKHFDKNGDGKIDPEELEIVMRSLNIKKTKAQLQDIFNEVDLDGNGTIDFSEFLILMSRQIKESWKSKTVPDKKTAGVKRFVKIITEAKKADHLTTQQVYNIRKAFTKFDSNRKGSITEKEFEGVMQTFGTKLTETQLLYLFREYDLDGNGEINFSELLHLMSKLIKGDIKDNIPARMADRLNPEQISEYRDIFKVFDKDGNGYITAKELKDVMESLGANVTQTQLQELIQEVDLDGNGTIDFSEFLILMSRQKKGAVGYRINVKSKRAAVDRFVETASKRMRIKRLTPEQIAKFKEAFSLFDKDSDGNITQNELETVMRSLGAKPTAKQLKSMMDEADIDDGGTIDFTEFLILMLRLMNEPDGYKVIPKGAKAVVNRLAMGASVPKKKTRLTPEQIVEIREAFMVFDKEGTGGITSYDVEKVMRSFNMHPTAEQLKSMVREADIDGNGIIDFTEFLMLMSREIKVIDSKTTPAEDLYGLTAEQIVEFRKLFMFIDEDSDGTISLEQLGNGIDLLGMHITEEQLQDMFYEADVDGSGKIEFTEFLLLMSPLVNETGEYKYIPKAQLTDHFDPEQIAEFKESFAYFDKDCDGNITAKELGILMRYLGTNTTEAELIDIVRSADVDGSGKIDFIEFLIILSNKMKEECNCISIPKINVGDRLSPYQIAEFREVFTRFDNDNDGYISGKELGSIMQALGLYPTESQLRQISHDAHIQWKGRIDLTSYFTLISYYMKDMGGYKRVTEIKFPIANCSDKEIPIPKKKIQHFTPEEISKFRETFVMFDVAGNGAITANELATGMRHLGMNFKDTEVQIMFNEVDVDRREIIGFDQFVKLMSFQLKDTGSYEKTYEAFRVFDKNGTGRISMNELRCIMTSLGEKLTKEEVEELIQDADIDVNGQINYAEFIAYMISK
ncbi:uncharacterized protein LOC119680298 [Teleopsis dalmanni]|uniref:uncharacterized protein LOC119680298 n=1 Tax=Teleopsis dalmanni TaxID=139649 RepID=UPI0018CF0776|nr:uncharacterized protein LOC119680298 [Teleopsis dalmanni]